MIRSSPPVLNPSEDTKDRVMKEAISQLINREGFVAFKAIPVLIPPLFSILSVIIFSESRELKSNLPLIILILIEITNKAPITRR